MLKASEPPFRVHFRSDLPETKKRQEHLEQTCTLIRRSAIRFIKPIVTVLVVLAVIGIRNHYHRNEFDIPLETTRTCLLKEIKALGPYEFWSGSVEAVNFCGEDLKLDLRPFANQDEVKFHIPTRLAGSDCAIVTLGVGRDVTAEQKMWRLMPYCKFYGADPIPTVNKELFSEVGTFFKLAVGSRDGMLTQYVYERQAENIPHYRDKIVKTRELYSFLAEDVKEDVVDQIMIDIEGSEYELIEKFLRKSRSEDVVICQINIEFHPKKVRERQMLYNFIKELVEEGTFLPLKATTHPDVDVKRVYFLNYGDAVCRDRYLYNPKIDEETRLKAKWNRTT